MIKKINLVIVGALTFAITFSSLSRTFSGFESYGVLISLLNGAAYFCLAGTLLLYFKDTNVGHNEAIAFAAFVGLGIEIFQYFLPFRTFALTDVAVNSIGASLIALDDQMELSDNVLQYENNLISKINSR